jgi:hypothetical protein
MKKRSVNRLLSSSSIALMMDSRSSTGWDEETSLVANVGREGVVVAVPPSAISDGKEDEGRDKRVGVCVRLALDLKTSFMDLRKPASDILVIGGLRL